MYEQTLTAGPDRHEPQPALPYRALAVLRRVLLRGYRALQSAARAVQAFGPVNTARAWLAGPLYRLRQAIAWGRTRTGLPMAGALLGLGAFALSDRGQALLSRGRDALGRLSATVMTVVGRWLTHHPLPAPVRSAVCWVAGMTRAALAPVRTLRARARQLARRVGLTARRGSYALTAATAAKLLVPAVPAVVVVMGALVGLVLLGGYGSETPEGTDPQDPAVVPSRDAAAAHTSMEHLAEVLPKIRAAVKDAVAQGDKDAVRDARRLLSSCRARTGELKQAAAALRADGDLPAELLPTLAGIDALVAEMTAEWAQLSAQLRDAAGNRGTRRAAASRARRQWSPDRRGGAVAPQHIPVTSRPPRRGGLRHVRRQFMYLVLSLAAAAAALVLLYNHQREGGADRTESWVGRAQQLAAVVLVLTRAVEGLLEALDHASGHRAVPAFGGSRMNGFDEEDWR